MKNKIKKKWNLRILIYIFIIFLFNLNLISAGTIVNSAPTSVSPNSRFNINYNINDVSGKWGAIIVQFLSGGCTINGKDTYRTVALSTDGITKNVEVLAPSSGSCRIIGYYQFSNDLNPKSFTEKTVTITGTQCTRDSDCPSGNYCFSNNCYLNEDINHDSLINMADLVSVAQNVGMENCNEGNLWCERKDVDHNLEVGLSDLARVARKM